MGSLISKKKRRPSMSRRTSIILVMLYALPYETSYQINNKGIFVDLELDEMRAVYLNVKTALIRYTSKFSHLELEDTDVPNKYRLAPKKWK